MAQSYLALSQTAQAAQFANQGLRYSQSGSGEARALERCALTQADKPPFRALLSGSIQGRTD